MSLTAFKRKSVVQYGTKRSGSAPGGIWLSQGPFRGGSNSLFSVASAGPQGFSLQGGCRNVGGIGRDMKMSKSGTPFRGAYAIGHGGHLGTYPSSVLVSTAESEGGVGALSNQPGVTAPVRPVLNAGIVPTQGSEYMYIKPSVLSTRGMLDRKYRSMYYGKYPHYWVQPVYTGNLTDTASQGMYIQSLASQHVTQLDVNNTDTYLYHQVACGPTLCTRGTSTARFTFDNMAHNAPYTKTLSQPVSYTGQYNTYLTRKCMNPTGAQKPFPFAVQTGTGVLTGGLSVGPVASACNTSNTYVVPPAWYVDPTVST
jgi:hypothetical protein